MNSFSKLFYHFLLVDPKDPDFLGPGKVVAVNSQNRLVPAGLDRSARIVGITQHPVILRYSTLDNDTGSTFFCGRVNTTVGSLT